MSDEMTLEPPGSIAVVGAGPLGIEAALYGRFLGYDVTIIEAKEVASTLRGYSSQPLPLSPDRCLSPLALAALQSQYPDFADTRAMTIGELVFDALVPLTVTDLLRGRLMCPARVTGIQTVDVELDEGENENEIPPDFRLAVSTIASTDVVDAEAVILAIGPEAAIELGFQTPAPYFFRIGQARSENAEQHFWSGLREIVSIYAALAGREDLDLYRPRRN